jgi:CubicO group peptidase (beta-lactamase class C family)
MEQIIARTFKLSYLIFTLFFLTFCKPSAKQIREEVEEESLNILTSQIDSLIETTNPRLFNGVILITKGEESIYVRERGYSSFKNKTPISIDDKFRIMSNSKQVTAVLTLKEVEKGTIDLEQTINYYLPDFNQPWADTVTVHQLLNMSSGISSLEKPLLFEPGNGYYYSNPSYGLLGQIIAQATGKSYATNANNLFEELGMSNTFSYELQGVSDGLVSGHALLNKEIKPVDFQQWEFTEEQWGLFLPAGGIVSDAYDLNTWDSKLHKGEILTSNSYAQMVDFSNWGPHAAFDYDTIGYSYGLRIHDKHPVYHLGHGGRGFGFVSIKFYIPEKDIDVIIWENIYHMDNFPNNADIIYHFENEIRKKILNSTLVK